MTDEAGYPLDDELQRIIEWPWGDYEHLFEFIEGLLAYHDFCWDMSDAEDDFRHEPIKRLNLSTAGWSGNESIVEAMEQNWLLRGTCWVQSRRGGHYIYEIAMNAWHDPDGKSVSPILENRE